MILIGLLAYLVRKNDGFCRTLMEQKEFAEFIWADWLRKSRTASFESCGLA